MLNSTPESVSFCITDPNLPDNPVIYISSGFTKLTGYEFDDIVGRNCRFLQGEKTSAADVKRISDALKSEKECSVNLLNYKKDGTEFVNEVRERDLDIYSILLKSHINVASALCSCHVYVTTNQHVSNSMCTKHNTHTVLLDTTENTTTRTGLFHWNSSGCSE